MAESRWSRWKRSWWVLLGLFPFGWLGWAAFLYAGIRARRSRWIAVAAVLLAAAVATFVAENDTTVGLIAIGTWAFSAIGVFVIRGRYLELTSGGPAEAEQGERLEQRRLVQPSLDADGPQPSWLLRSRLVRLVVLPLFSLGVVGVGVSSLSESVVRGLLLIGIGLMMLYGAFAAESRFGSGRIPVFLRPRFRHSLYTGSASGLNEYHLRQALLPRLLIGGATASFFLLPNLWFGVPPWLNGVLAAAGLVAALPIVRQATTTLRIGPRRLEVESAGARIDATAWVADVVTFHGNPATTLFLADGKARIAATARLLHRLSASLGQDPERMVIVQPFLDAAALEGADVAEALRRDLESGVPADATAEEPTASWAEAR